MGGGGEGLEMLACQFGVGDGHEGRVPLRLLREVAIAEDLRGGGLCGGEEGKRKKADGSA